MASKGYQAAPEDDDIESLNIQDSQDNETKPCVKNAIGVGIFLVLLGGIILMAGFVFKGTVEGDKRLHYVLDTTYSLNGADFEVESCQSVLINDGFLYVGQSSSAVSSPLLSIWNLKTGRYVSEWTDVDEIVGIHALTYSEELDILFVVDQKDDNIKAYTLSGEFLYQSDASLDLTEPTDLAIGNDGYLYVTDGEGSNNRVVVLDVDFNLITDFGTSGENVGELDLPHGAAVDHDDLLWVADEGNGMYVCVTPQTIFLTLLPCLATLLMLSFHQTASSSSFPLLGSPMN